MLAAINDNITARVHSARPSSFFCLQAAESHAPPRATPSTPPSATRGAAPLAVSAVLACHCQACCHANWHPARRPSSRVAVSRTGAGYSGIAPSASSSSSSKTRGHVTRVRVFHFAARASTSTARRASASAISAVVGSSEPVRSRAHRLACLTRSVCFLVVAIPPYTLAFALALALDILPSAALMAEVTVGREGSRREAAPPTAAAADAAARGRENALTGRDLDDPCARLRVGIFICPSILPPVASSCTSVSFTAMECRPLSQPPTAPAASCAERSSARRSSTALGVALPPSPPMLMPLALASAEARSDTASAVPASVEPAREPPSLLSSTSAWEAGEERPRARRGSTSPPPGGAARRRVAARSRTSCSASACDAVGDSGDARSARAPA